MYQNIPGNLAYYRDNDQEHHHDKKDNYNNHHCGQCSQNINNQGMMYPFAAQNGMYSMKYPNTDPNDEHGMMKHPHQNLLNTIQHCEGVCEHMTTMLKHRHDLHMRLNQLSILRDCADICTLMAKYLARMSQFSRKLADLCGDICETCGKECAKFEDPESQHCSRVCLDCARECNAFARQR